MGKLLFSGELAKGSSCKVENESMTFRDIPESGKKNNVGKWYTFYFKCSAGKKL
jgi:hypothetical protein